MFQDGCRPFIEWIDYFHDYRLLILIMITISLGVMMVDLIITTFRDVRFMYDQMVEMYWTMFPGVVLVLIAFPSLRLLYVIDESNVPGITIKVLGRQWYWVYEYSNFEGVVVERYILPYGSLEYGDYRLLDVDTRGSAPCMNQVRLLVSREDVLHRWTIPSMGVKVDAVPGRLNQVTLHSNVAGIMYGQCREVCGANHSFIPVVFEIVPSREFRKWVFSL